MFNFTVSYAKKSMTLGLIVLVIGISVISFLLLFPHTDTVIQNSIDVTTTGIYSSDKFRAESGYWLDLDINSSGVSTIHVVGQTVGEIFRVDGTTYKYNVSISSGDVYQVQVENKAGHYEYIIIWVPDENHIAGSFYLKRTAAYFFQLLPVGAILLAVGSLIIPITVYVEYNARQRAKLLYKCPRCGKEVNIGLEICPYCKLDLTKYWVRCKYCNKFYDSHLEKCPKCGAETEV
jgi:RNA polymerase subunit RPABC4/transcription elongation factor Spt4